MIVVRLWWSLNRAFPGNPLLREVALRQRRAPDDRPTIGCGTSGIFLLLLVSMPILIATVQQWAMIVLLSVSMLIGLMLADRTGGGIALEREKRRDELLAVTPMGLPGAYWVTAVFSLQRSPLLTQLIGLHLLGMVTLGGMLVFLVGLQLMVWLSRQHQFLSVPDLHTFMIVVILLSVIAWSDLIQATVMGALTGIQVAVVAGERFFARFLALALYLLLYYPSLIAAYVLALAVIDSYAVDNVAGFVSLYVMLLVFMWLIRYALVILMLRLLTGVSRTDYAEWQSLWKG